MQESWVTIQKYLYACYVYSCMFRENTLVCLQNKNVIPQLSIYISSHLQVFSTCNRKVVRQTVKFDNLLSLKSWGYLVLFSHTFLFFLEVPINVLLSIWNKNKVCTFFQSYAQNHQNQGSYCVYRKQLFLNEIKHAYCIWLFILLFDYYVLFISDSFYFQFCSC